MESNPITFHSYSKAISFYRENNPARQKSFTLEDANTTGVGGSIDRSQDWAKLAYWIHRALKPYPKEHAKLWLWWKLVGGKKDPHNPDASITMGMVAKKIVGVKSRRGWEIVGQIDSHLERLFIGMNLIPKPEDYE